MKTKSLILTLLSLLVLTSCGNSSNDSSEPVEKPIMMINDFESLSQLSLMKFPFPKHADRGRFDLSTEHVTNGEKSLKYSNTYGSYVEVCHYFSHTVDEGINIANIKSIELDIYNDSDFDTTATLSIYFEKDLSTLLNLNIDLKKDEMTHVSFPLSKVAIENNYDKIVCSSLRLNTFNTNYDKGIGYTFFVDNWHAVMGAEYTEEDLHYKAIVEDVTAKIEALPQTEYISLEHTDYLNNIAETIASLPELYRRAIPNMDTYKTCVNKYSDVYNKSIEITYDRDTFLNFDKFFGIAQIENTPDTIADYYYEKIKWPDQIESEGALKIDFQGGLDNKFYYLSKLSLTNYDFLGFRMYNASKNYIRMWFSYASNVYVDISAGEVKEFTLPTSALLNQDYWSFLHLESSTSSSLVASSGSIYISEVVAKGRSQKTLTEQLNYCLDLLPSVEALEGEDAYINSMTVISAARKILDRIANTSSIDEEKISLLYDLEQKVKESGYRIAYDAYDSAMVKHDYGASFEATVSVKDDRFGYVTAAHLRDVPAHKDNPKLYEQGITFGAPTSTVGDFDHFTIYINNPLTRSVRLTVINNEWIDWDNADVITNATLLPGWNKIDITNANMLATKDNKVFFLISNDGGGYSIDGDWLFSSLYGIPA